MKKLLILLILTMTSSIVFSEQKTLLIFVDYQGNYFEVQSIRVVHQTLDANFSEREGQGDLKLKISTDSGDVIRTGFMPNPAQGHTVIDEHNVDQELHESFSQDAGTFMIRTPYVSGIRYIEIEPAEQNVTRSASKPAPTAAHNTVLDLQLYLP
jgi:hypothetical protein